MISVDVSWQRRLGRIGSSLFHECVHIVCRHARRRKAAVSFVLLDDERIRELNRAYLEHDYATDVITFSLGEPGALDGEIYIGVDVAVRQAREYGVPVREEVARLAIHGLLHLLGYDDRDAGSAAAMHQVQERLVAAWRGASSHVD